MSRKESAGALDLRLPMRAEQRIAPEMLFALLVAKGSHALNATRVQEHLDAQRQLAGPPAEVSEAESIRWRRH